jgi:hypothetical protein
MYLPPGEYTASVAGWGLNGSTGYNTSSSLIHMSPGESIIGLEFILNRSRVPFEDGTTAGLVVTATASELVLNPRGKKPKREIR